MNKYTTILIFIFTLSINGCKKDSDTPPESDSLYQTYITTWNFKYENDNLGLLVITLAHDKNKDVYIKGKLYFFDTKDTDLLRKYNSDFYDKIINKDDSILSASTIEDFAESYFSKLHIFSKSKYINNDDLLKMMDFSPVQLGLTQKGFSILDILTKLVPAAYAQNFNIIRLNQIDPLWGTWGIITTTSLLTHTGIGMGVAITAGGVVGLSIGAGVFFWQYVGGGTGVTSLWNLPGFLWNGVQVLGNLEELVNKFTCPIVEALNGKCNEPSINAKLDNIKREIEKIFDQLKYDMENAAYSLRSRLITSISTSDPHLTSFDFNRYSFMAVGEFTAVKSTTDNFEIQVRQEELKPLSNNGTVSWNTGLAIRTGDGDVCIYPPNSVFVNKQKLHSDFALHHLSNNGTVEKNDNEVIITNTRGDLITVKLFSDNLDYFISPNEGRKNKVRGLFGNYDGSAENDLVLSTGEKITNKYEDLYPKFADSWRIKQSESLFVYDSGKNTSSYTDRSFPRQPINLSTSQRNSAKTICENAGITDPFLLESCIIDVASTNDPSLAARIYQSQLVGEAIKEYSISDFSSSKIKFANSGVSFSDKEAVLDTKVQGSSTLAINQGVYLKNGFETEFTFSTNNLVSPSYFYLAVWQTSKLDNNEERAGFIFYPPKDGAASAEYIVQRGGGTSIVESSYGTTPNYVDGKNHKVKIIERQTNDKSWIIELFFDNYSAPIYTAYSDKTLAQRLHTSNSIGFIQLSVIQNNSDISPSVKISNWSFKSF